MNIERILSIENNLVNVLLYNWQKIYVSYMTRLLVALKSGNSDAAKKIVDDFSLDSLGDTKSISSYSAMAFKFGSQQVTRSPQVKNDLHQEALDLFKMMIEQNVALQIKK